MSTDEILEKLVKLKRHAESAEAIGSEAEAEAFSQLFQRLLVKHKLEMSEVEFAAQDKEDPVQAHYIDYRQYPDLKLKKRRVSWSETLGHIIAKAHFCQTLVHDGTNRVTFVGRKHDVKVAEYMFVTLHRAAEKLADRAYAQFSTACVKECRYCKRSKAEHITSVHKFVPNWAKARGYRPAFINAFILRLYERYEEERRRSRQTSDVTALVRLNTSEEAVKEYLKKYKNASQLGRPDIRNRHGMAHGVDAANDVNLRANAVSANGAVANLPEKKMTERQKSINELYRDFREKGDDKMNAVSRLKDFGGATDAEVKLAQIEYGDKPGVEEEEDGA